MHTEAEIQVAKKLEPLIEEYESADMGSRPAFLEEINDLAGSPVSEFELLTYWESCSLDDFALSLAISVQSADGFTKDAALAVVAQICETDDIAEIDYLTTKYSNAVEFVFRKPSGFLSDVVGSESGFEEVVDRLTSDERGPICL